MSYELKIDPKSRTAGRLIGQVRKALVSAAIDAKKETGISQQQIASKLGVNRSVINRLLRGEANLTLRSVAEIAWALGRVPEFKLIDPTPHQSGCNQITDLDPYPVHTRTESNSTIVRPSVPPRSDNGPAPTTVSVVPTPAYELADV